MPSNVNGFGTKYYGQRDFRLDGSYVTTNFFCLGFFPVIPLHSVRVIPDPKNSWMPVFKELLRDTGEALAQPVAGPFHLFMVGGSRWHGHPVLLEKSNLFSRTVACGWRKAGRKPSCAAFAL